MPLIRFYLSRYPHETALAVTCMVLALAVEAVGLSVALPLLSLAMGDGAAASGAPSALQETVSGVFQRLDFHPTLASLSVVVAVAFTIKALILVIARRQIGYTVAHVATDLRIELLRGVLSTNWSWYTRQPAGRIANSFATEADRASRSYLELAQIAGYTIESITYGALALAVSWQATAGAAVAAAVTVVALSPLVRIAGRAGRKQTRLMGGLLGRLTDSLQAVKLLKATGREALAGPLLERDTQKLNNALRKQVMSKESMRALQEPIMVAFLMVAVFIGREMLEMPFATVGMVALLFVRTLHSANKTQRRYQHMVADASALWALRDLIDRAEAAKEHTLGSGEPTLDTSLTLEGVAVRYDDTTVLDGIDIEVPAGRITAIIGASGSGKTTLIDVITGLVRPEAGDVHLDGVALAELDLAKWRQRLGYVTQEMLLLHDSVRLNVTLGDERFGDADIEQALRDAGAWDFVCEMPEGLESSVGERGGLLSGGQRQRLAIARALLRKPSLLILDEATAALDPANEAAVWETVETLRGKTTVIAISHQPALAGVADRIYRIVSGRAERVSAPAVLAGSTQEVA
jgi:ATP-binding cassette subfamily C protein